MRSRRLVVSLRALADLRADYSYIADFNPSAARRRLDDTNAKMMSLAKIGITGTAREFIPGLRAFPHRNRCIYFLIDDDTMTVVRVLHGRQKTSAEDFVSAGPDNEKT